MSKFLIQENSQEKIIAGLHRAASIIASTLGPRGSVVIIQNKDRKSFATRDGVTVSKNIAFDDPIENLGADILLQATEQTANAAGDGTTTTAVLASALLQNFKMTQIYSERVSTLKLKNEIERVILEVVRELKEGSIPVRKREDIVNIATISANGDSVLGEIVATAIDEIGNDGAITIENARSTETTLKVVEGFRFDTGFASSAFITDEKRSLVHYDNPIIYVSDYKIDAVAELMPVLELAARANQPLIVVAEEVTGQALAALVMNTVRGTLKIAAVRAPKFGQERRDVLSDLAISVGATFVTRESGFDIQKIKLTDLGGAGSIEIRRDATVIIGGKGSSDVVLSRIQTLKDQIQENDNLFECQKFQERITRLISAVAIIYVGGSTEIEALEKKFRIEDALEAVKSAQQEGVAIGGGYALLKISMQMKKDLHLASDGDSLIQFLARQIVSEAIAEPFRKIIEALPISESEICAKFLDSDFQIGFDANKEVFVNLKEAGILDPVKVIRMALQNAFSVVSTIMTSNVGIVER